MSVREFLVRSMLAGLSIGIPAYGLGSLLFSGRRIPVALLTVIGGMGGFAAAFIVLSGLAPPWAPVVVAGLIAAGLGAGTFALIPRGQKALRGHR